MSEGLVATIITAIAAPIVLLAVQQFFLRRKNKLDYGDNLLEGMNKMSEQLKKARQEISEMDTQLRQLDQTHEQEIQDLQHQHKRERERLRNRLDILEKVLVRYSISFTLRTHPDIQIENLKVTGMEDVSDSQKLKAMTPQQVLEDKQKREKGK